MKKIKILLMCTFLLTLSACVAKEDDLAKRSQKYAWALATSSPEDTITGIYAHRFAQEVERLSNGDIQMEVYDNGTLGGDRELLESCKEGDIPFVVQNTAPQVSFMEELAIFDLPMAFDNLEQLRTLLDDEQFIDVINDIYEKSGYHLLGMGDQSFRVTTSNVNVENVDDFTGMKIRTMENSLHIEFWKSINANPTPMAFSEVYIGLQQGTIVAQENPIEVIVSSKLYEQQDYVIETNHLPHLLSLIVTKDFYEQLDDEQKAIVDEAATNAKQYAREQADARAADRLAQIEASGTEIVSLSEETKAQVIEKSSDLYEKIKAIAGEELYNAYTKYLKENN